MQPLERRDPRVVGRYRILARIGAGGMAIIYFGRSVSGRPVAVKAMHADFADDPAYRARFAGEVVATRAVGGRYSPGVLDADPDAAIPWLAVDFLPSVSLHEASPLPPDAVWPLAAGLVEALASIHAAGIVHLDLTPRNVLLTASGPRVIDFGVAAQARSGAPVSRAGSRGFMAPEAVVGPANDVYSLGATLAHACPDASGAARELIDSCLRTDPSSRPTIADLADRLSSASADWMPPAVVAEIDRRAREANAPFAEPVPRRFDRRAVLALAGGALVAGGVTWFATRPRLTTGQARPVPAPTSSSTPRGVAVKTTRSLEIYVAGTATPKTVTITVNNLPAETITALPWRKTYTIPEWSIQKTTVTITYLFAPGTYRYRFTVDEQDRATGGGQSTYDHGEARTETFEI